MTALQSFVISRHRLRLPPPTHSMIIFYNHDTWVEDGARRPGGAARNDASPHVTALPRTVLKTADGTRPRTRSNAACAQSHPDRLVERASRSHQPGLPCPVAPAV